MSLSAPVVSEAVPTLSAAMRDGSREQHEAAEHSPFVSELLGGKVNEQGYIDYLLRLRMVYAALEDAVRSHRNDPLVAVVYDPALERVSAIDADLDHWAPGVDRAIESPAAHAYRDRLAGATWGGAVLAHHYTRYLGDLSGGQVIGRMLDRTFGLQGAGLGFYEFPIRTKPYKDSYRASIDGLELQADEVDRVVDEVKVAFRLNQGVFDELSQNLAGYAR